MLLVCYTYQEKTHTALMRKVMRCSDANVFIDIPSPTMLDVVDLIFDKSLGFLTSVGDMH